MEFPFHLAFETSCIEPMWVGRCITNGKGQASKIDDDLTIREE